MTVFSDPKPAVVGHRGAPMQAPENSPEAFAAAAAAGAGWIELDARFAADGVVVVYHDAHTADGVAVIEQSSTELSEAGVWRLDTVLDGLPDGLGANVEVKNVPLDPGYHEDGALAQTVARMIDQRTHVRPFMTSSFNPFDVEELAAALPDIPVGQLYKASTPHEAAIEMALDRGAKALCAPVKSLDRAGLEAAHAAGLELMVWTVNDLDQAASLAEWGVDAICTDDPVGLVRRLAGR